MPVTGVGFSGRFGNVISRAKRTGEQTAKWLSTKCSHNMLYSFFYGISLYTQNFMHPEISSINDVTESALRPQLSYTYMQNLAANSTSFFGGLYFNGFDDRSKKFVNYWNDSLKLFGFFSKNGYQRLTNDPMRNFKNDILPDIHVDKWRTFKNILSTVVTDTIWYGIKSALWKSQKIRVFRILCERIKFLPGIKGKVLFYGIPVTISLFEVAAHAILQKGITLGAEILE